jgi:hypothetical protein
MSDDWIVWIKKITMGVVLISTINNFEVKTAVLMEYSHVMEYSQESRRDDIPIQELRAAAASAELAGQEQVHGPEYLYEAQQPQTLDQVQEEANSPDHELEHLDHELEHLAEVTKSLTETEEDKRREDPQAILELLQGRQAALDGLLESQKRDDAEKHAENVGFREDLAERHAGSPDQEKYLNKFDDVVEADKADRDDKYAAQVRELDEQWQQKFKEFDEQPLTIPTVPDRDRDDEDR